jgi:hypothetical protein
LYNNLASCGEYSIHCALGQLKKEEIEGLLLTPLRILQMRRAFIAAFTSEKRWMTIKKKFIPLLAIDTEFFHSTFAKLCTMLNQRCSQSGVCLTAYLVIKCLMTNYCIR